MQTFEIIYYNLRNHGPASCGIMDSRTCKQKYGKEKDSG